MQSPALNSHTRVHNHACAPPAHRQRHTPPTCVTTLALVGAASPPTHPPLTPDPFPHPPPGPAAPPPFPAPCAPLRPRFLFTVTEPPARPSRHRGRLPGQGHRRGSLHMAPVQPPRLCLTPVTVELLPGCAGSPAPHGATAHSGKAAGNPDGRRAGPHMAQAGRGKAAACGGTGAPSHTLRCRAHLDHLAEAWPRAQVGGSREVPCPGSRRVTRSRGRNRALGRTHCAAFPRAEPRCWELGSAHPGARPVGKLRHRLGK